MDESSDLTVLRLYFLIRNLLVRLKGDKEKSGININDVNKQQCLHKSRYVVICENL